jgi:hypothetical protein
MTMSSATTPMIRARRGAAVLALSLTVGALVATGTPPRSADAQEEPRFNADASRPRQCHAGAVPGQRGVDGFEVTATETGLVRVRLRPLARTLTSADWDVAVFDRADQRLVAASAAPRSYELADGFVTAGDRLWVQGCRYAGRAGSVAVSVDFYPTPTTGTSASSADPAQLVTVTARGRGAKDRLARLGVELTEAATPETADAVLRGRAEADRLRAAGFRWTVKIPDLAAQAQRVQAADRAYASATAVSALPSGRTSYRRLADYDYEMKELARRHPGLVKVFTLSRRTIEGRDITGVEIAENVSDLGDGKPIFLNLGVHHAREWPSGEHAMEWAHDLVTGYDRDARTTRLVEATRNIVVPVVNPDGFSVSREATPLGNFSAFDFENMRKNCNPAQAPTPTDALGPCPVNPVGIARGTDLNRNYGAFWGGVGASPLPADVTYRGAAPFSEPESQAVRELVSKRPVTNLITNHTYGNLLLRPPGVAATGQPVDEPILRSLGEAMSDRNGYSNFRGFQLYDTTGTTDDWSYWITGGLSYTFEIGLEGFHPEFESGVVAEYLGLAPSEGEGRGGNRAAYFEMLESTANASHHATLTGRAPQGWKLRVHKAFQTPTSPVLQPDGSEQPPVLVTDVLDNTLTAPAGDFRWSLNPSTRPYVAGRYGREPVADPQPPFPLVNPAGQPAENTGPPTVGPREEVPFTVQGPPAVDNGEVRVRIEWSDAATDWDVYVLDADGEIVTQSASFGADYEEATLLDPPPGDYTAVIINYDQVDGAPYDDWTGGVSFLGPRPAVPGTTEPWLLTCERPNGSVVSSQQVTLARGQTVNLGTVCDTRRKARS